MTNETKERLACYLISFSLLEEGERYIQSAYNIADSCVVAYRYRLYQYDQ